MARQKRGYLQDWLTQLWVKSTGRHIDKEQHAWLLGPFGETSIIDSTFVDQLIAEEGLSIQKNETGFGLLNSIEELHLKDRKRLNEKVKDFYEHTIAYDFEVWSSWCGFFYPFGWLLNILFSKRLQQLNLPLKPLDTAQGLQSNIWKLYDKAGQPKHTIWYRILKSNKDVIYSGVYSTTHLANDKLTCLKVAFPLPNGNATVVMKPRVLEDGSLLLISEGEKFGDAGFYFLLTNHQGKYWAKVCKSHA